MATRDSAYLSCLVFFTDFTIALLFPGAVNIAGGDWLVRIGPVSLRTR